jgi:hypothetical protein
MNLRTYMMKACGIAINDATRDYRNDTRPKLDAWARWRRRSSDI